MSEGSSHWQDHLPGRPDTVEFLPLAREGVGGDAGWCVYAKEFENAPDVEVFCGGKNSKLPTAAALWRQGHLFHFGFQQDPSQLNETGRDLLANCIWYIARFRGDRAIGHVRSGFAPAGRLERMVFVDSVFGSDTVDVEKAAERFFAGAFLERVCSLDAAAARAAIEAHRQALVQRQGDGKFDLDDDLVDLGMDLRAEEFPATAARRLDDDGEARAALCRVLHRQIPSGPRDGEQPASAEAWRTFLEEDGRYLFFSDAAGSLWLLDPLAQERGLPSALLRGPARGAWGPR